MHRWHLCWLIVIPVLLLAGCSAAGEGRAAGVRATPLPAVRQSIDPTATPAGPVRPDPLVSIGSSVAPDAPPEDCPVTRPPAAPFTPPPPYPPQAPYPGEFWYGSKALWTILPAAGTWRDLPYHDGSYSQKVFWWRQGYNGRTEPEPKLALTVKRLDAPGPVIEVGPTATNAYHSDFNWAMLAGVDFPTPGCWQITGRYQGHELSFVIWVAP